MPLKLLIQLSSRNLTRHKRRNFMLLMAICVAVAGVTFMNSLIRGFQYDMQDSAVANLTGHVKVLAPGYLDDPGIQKSFKLAENWQPDIAACRTENLQHARPAFSGVQQRRRHFFGDRNVCRYPACSAYPGAQGESPAAG